MKTNTKRIRNPKLDQWKVKFKVTGAFGDCNIGDILDAYLLCQDGNHGLLYHPADKHGCGSFDICIPFDGMWVTADEDYYINMITLNPKFKKFLKELK